MWKKHKRITQEEIKEIELKLENLPSKKSNLAILDEKILSLLESPRQFLESINTKQKRRLQDVLFPDGLHYSPKTKEYRTSNIHLLLEITGCFIDTWTSEKNKTRRQNVFGSRVVDILENRSNVKSNHLNQIRFRVSYCPARPSIDLNFLFGIFRKHVCNCIPVPEVDHISLRSPHLSVWNTNVRLYAVNSHKNRVDGCSWNTLGSRDHWLFHRNLGF
jgi:hypothetical protein